MLGYPKKFSFGVAFGGIHGNVFVPSSTRGKIMRMGGCW